jgi:phage replisome organizer N-terminal domain protein|uniref:Replisome organizer n=1 Tax=Siphoviridae sp. ctOow3 TaxID=2826315 RepID=A0A8S5QYU7_9CAUD|nr:MAG TPA: replisome organizer [Siphoviridae sp. ctOow3]
MIKITRANRRYYWLQLKEDFFKTKEMKLMRKLPGGEEITIIYLKIMLVSLADEGKIFFEGLAEDLAEELSLLIDEDAEAVRMALIFLEQKKLLTTSDNYQYNLEQVPEMIGSETASTRRARKHRENQKALQCNTDATKRNGEIDIDIEIEIDKDIEIDNNNKTISPSLSENLKSSGIRINEKQHQQLLEYVGIDGMSFDMLNRAIEITSGVHQPSFNYLKAILEKWKEKGFTSLEQVDEHEEERQSAKNTTSRRVGNSIIQTYDDPLPF